MFALIVFFIFAVSFQRLYNIKWIVCSFIHNICGFITV